MIELLEFFEALDVGTMIFMVFVLTPLLVIREVTRGKKDE